MTPCASCTARDPLTVMDAAQQLVGLYGNKRAAAIAAQAATALGVETSPLFKQLQKNIAGAGDIRTWKSGQRTARAAVGDQMVAVIPATKQLEMRKDGVDFTSPAYKAALVDYVEQLGKAISYGATDAENGRFAVDLTTWPVAMKQSPLEEFLRYEPKKLSHKATAGFERRLASSTLRAPDAFRVALRTHLARMAEA